VITEENEDQEESTGMYVNIKFDNIAMIVLEKGSYGPDQDNIIFSNERGKVLNEHRQAYAKFFLRNTEIKINMGQSSGDSDNPENSVEKKNMEIMINSDVFNGYEVIKFKNNEYYERGFLGI